MTQAAESAAIGFGYGCALLVWALLSVGFGHGTFLPAAIASAPWSLLWRPAFFAAPVWWALAGWALGSRSRLALTLLALHALGVVVCLSRGSPWESVSQQWKNLGQASRVMPMFVWPGFALYLAGQVVAWRRALRAPESGAGLVRES